MNANIQRSLIQSSDTRWIEFIQTCPDANIFHHPAWLDLMTDSYGYSSTILVLFDENGEIRSGLPLMKIKSPLRGNRWVALPFSDFCVPLSKDEKTYQELSEQLVKFSHQQKTNKIEIRWTLAEHKEIKSQSNFVLHTINLDPDPSQVAKNIKRTHLQNIRQAEKRGVSVEFGSQLEHLRVFYNLQLETRRRHGVPIQPWKYFKLLWRYIVKPGMGFVLLARKDHEYIAGMVYLGWGKTLMAKYAASRAESFNLRPNNLLFWEGIQWGCKNGYKKFDMGRTELNNNGLREFKIRWGAVEEPLHYSTIGAKNVQPMNGRLEGLMSSLIRNTPAFVCKITGELLYKHFG